MICGMARIGVESAGECDASQNVPREVAIRAAMVKAQRGQRVVSPDRLEEVRLDLHKDGTCETIQARMVATMPRGLFRGIPEHPGV